MTQQDLFDAIETSRKIAKALRKGHGKWVIVTHRVIDFVVLCEQRAYLEKQARGSVTVVYEGGA